MPSAAADPATAAARLYERYWEELLRLDPLTATYIGDERYNDRLADTASPQFARRRKDFNHRYHQAALRIRSDSLPAQQRTSHEIFLRQLSLEIEGERFRSELLPINQMGSLALQFAVLGSGGGVQPFRDARDYENFLERSEDFLRWVDSAIERLRAGERAGVTQPRVVMQKVLPQLREIGVEDPQQSVFWQTVKAMPQDIPAATRARLTERYRVQLGRHILPAYRRLADFIETRYLPAARESVGLSALPDGQAWYQYLVRTQTTTDLTADEIHALGLAEVARIRAEMESVKREVGFAGDLAAFFRHLQTDPQFYFSSGAELLDAYRDLKRRIDALLPKLFAEMPRADYEIRAVESFRAASAPGAFYQRPSADGRRPGIFYVNTYDLRAQPRFGMETLSLHEAAPGHHFQIAIQQELTGLPAFRRFSNYTAYAEGWALYAESIGKELGLFADPYQWFGRLNDEMLRAMRLVVDTGLHSKRWSREQAIAYMRENSSMAESDIVAEVERYIAIPAQALGYKIGQLEISAIRSRASAALGTAFDVRAFHSEMLRDGAMPLAVLRAKVDLWTQERLRDRARTSDRS